MFKNISKKSHFAILRAKQATLIFKLKVFEFPANKSILEPTFFSFWARKFKVPIRNFLTNFKAKKVSKKKNRCPKFELCVNRPLEIRVKLKLEFFFVDTEKCPNSNTKIFYVPSCHE